MIQKVLKLLFVICLFGFQNVQAQNAPSPIPLER